jgi:hypothetical protein
MNFLPDDEAISSNRAVATVSWKFALPEGQRIAALASRPSHDPIASIGRVLADRSVRYKYVNPNTMVIAASDAVKSTLTTFLVDTVAGEVLASATHVGVDVLKPVTCVLSENWFACSWFASYVLSDGTNGSVTGYHISVSDLFESLHADDRGPLGNSLSASSLDPLNSPLIDIAPLPAVVSQTYIISAPVTAMCVTQTRQGITTRHVLAYLPETRAITAIPRPALDPRRPVGRDPTSAELEAEGLARYAPAFDVDDARALLTHQREVIGVRQIMAVGAIVESTSLVLAYGIDVFGTRTAPSQVFDILGRGFPKITVLLTVGAIVAAVIVLRPMVGFPPFFLYHTAPFL